MKDRRVDGVRDDRRLAELEPELAMLLEAVARLQDGRLGELGIHRCDRAIGAVVEAAVHADRPVHAMHHAAAGAREAPQPLRIEVERVEETGRRPGRETVQLDHEPATFELAEERPQELVTAAGWRWRELVEEREVGTPATRAEPVEFESARVARRLVRFVGPPAQPHEDARRRR